MWESNSQLYTTIQVQCVTWWSRTVVNSFIWRLSTPPIHKTNLTVSVFSMGCHACHIISSFGACTYKVTSGKKGPILHYIYIYGPLQFLIRYIYILNVKYWLINSVCVYIGPVIWKYTLCRQIFQNCTSNSFQVFFSQKSE